MFLITVVNLLCYKLFNHIYNRAWYGILILQPIGRQTILVQGISKVLRQASSLILPKDGHTRPASVGSVTATSLLVYLTLMNMSQQKIITRSEKMPRISLQITRITVPYIFIGGYSDPRAILSDLQDRLLQITLSAARMSLLLQRRVRLSHLSIRYILKDIALDIVVKRQLVPQIPQKDSGRLEGPQKNVTWFGGLVHHYYTKSEEDFYRKMSRGSPHHFAENRSTLDRFNKTNDVTTGICNYTIEIAKKCCM
eukprot:TRINITY_DN2336_c0_g2_i1.p2 TRINITY_DN2336_c0_g2~~TRINITY_DN2336_c0_g2_i1.p2  ORF type:complete len:253 (+),score=-12.07 TRINITY_DN2336_c0_g2_i1:339-1097(+)